MKQSQRTNSGRDFSEVLMLTAVAGCIAQVIEAVLELGRVVHWWP